MAMHYAFMQSMPLLVPNSTIFLGEIDIVNSLWGYVDIVKRFQRVSTGGCGKVRILS